MSLEHLLEVYGYPVLFVGTFVEGETPLLMAGFLAHRGYLTLPWVVVVAFVATLSSDQLYFHLGRSQGRAFLARHPAWQSRATQANALLQRWGLPLVVGFRFLYGLRTAMPFVVGMSGFDPARFLLLNTLGAAVWSVLVGVLGYALGGVLKAFLEDVRPYELLVLLVIASGSVALWLYHLYRRRRGPRRQTAE